jgi:hypothetical protein
VHCCSSSKDEKQIWPEPKECTEVRKTMKQSFRSVPAMCELPENGTQIILWWLIALCARV